VQVVPDRIGGVFVILSGVPFAPRSKILIPTGKDHNPYFAGSL
jgi:hypothetical protein